MLADISFSVIFEQLVCIHFSLQLLPVLTNHMCLHAWSMHVLCEFHAWSRYMAMLFLTWNCMVHACSMHDPYTKTKSSTKLNLLRKKFTEPSESSITKKAFQSKESSLEDIDGVSKLISETSACSKSSQRQLFIFFIMLLFERT